MCCKNTWSFILTRQSLLHCWQPTGANSPAKVTIYSALSVFALTRLDIFFILTLHSDNGHEGYHYDIAQSYCS